MLTHLDYLRTFTAEEQEYSSTIPDFVCVCIYVFYTFNYLILK